MLNKIRLRPTPRAERRVARLSYGDTLIATETTLYGLVQSLETYRKTPTESTVSELEVGVEALTALVASIRSRTVKHNI